MGPLPFFPSLSQISHLPWELKKRLNDPALSWPNQVRFSQDFQDTFFYLKLTFFGPNFFDLKKTKKKRKLFQTPPQKKIFDLKKNKKKTKTFSTPPPKKIFLT